jgi:hypothetical protein
MCASTHTNRYMQKFPYTCGVYLYCVCFRCGHSQQNVQWNSSSPLPEIRTVLCVCVCVCVCVDHRRTIIIACYHPSHNVTPTTTLLLLAIVPFIYKSEAMSKTWLICINDLSRVLSEKLIVDQLKISSTIYKTQRFISLFTMALS